jgi:protein SCO1/2
MNRRRLLSLLALLPVAAVAAPAAQFLEERARRRVVRPTRGFHRDYFPNVALQTHDGRRVRLYDDLLSGRNVLVHFFRADPDDVGQRDAIANLHRLQTLLGDRAGRDVFLYSFSLVPERDTPARLARHHTDCGAGRGWTFLTGAPRDLDLCRVRFGFVDADPSRRRPRRWDVVLLGNEPHQRWMASHVLARPEYLLDQLNRVAGLKG